METDSLLVNFGVILMIFAAFMAAFYLIRERGSFLDPITIAWGGYMVFIAGAMFLTGLFIPNRRGQDSASMGVVLMILGTIGYTVGLYSGRLERFARHLPRPRPTLNLPQVWFTWAFCLAIAIALINVVRAGETEFRNIFGAVIHGATSTLVLIGLLVIFTTRGNWFSKFVMLLSIGAAFFLTYTTSFSRRPVLSLFSAGLAMIYHMKLRRLNLGVKLIFGSVFLVGAFFVNLYLDAVRANIYYGDVVRREEVLSARNLRGNVGGITINYEVFEVMLETFPQSKNMLLGTGIIPAFVYFVPRAFWEDKPWPSGWIATQIWFNRTNPESNVACTMVGEWYMNFGIPGVLFGMFIVGRVIRLLNTYLRQNTDNVVLWLAWFIVIPDLMGQFRGDFTSMTAQGMNRIVIFLGLSLIAGLLFPVRTHAPSLPRPGLLPSRARPLASSAPLAWPASQPAR